MNWYCKSREAVESLFGDDSDLFLQCLAATSPRSTVKCNVTLARKAYEVMKDGRDFTGFIHSHKVNLERIGRGEDIQGQKVTAFLANLRGDSSRVTIDRWMMRHYGYDNDIPTRRQYQEITYRITTEASARGMTAADYQAELWVKIRGINTSFVNYLGGRQLQFAIA